MYAMEQWWIAGDPWVRAIPHVWHDTALLAAYMHDVGKGGDGDFVSLVKPGWKADHPDVGFKFLIGKRPYHESNSGTDIRSVNLWDELTASGVSPFFVAAACTSCLRMCHRA